jgi:D-xylulose reductase
VVFEASGHAGVYQSLLDLVCPGGCAVLVGMPPEPVALDVVTMQTKEVRLESVFRYANIFPGTGAAELGNDRCEAFHFTQLPLLAGHPAFEEAARGRPQDVKIQIEMEG